MSRTPLVSPLDRILCLKAQHYLEDQPPGLLTALASYSDEKFYAAGSPIREADRPVDRILFLARGRVSISNRGMGATSRTEIDAPGVIGLPHHFAGAVRAPAVHAATDTLCLEMATVDLDQILEDHFSLVLEFAERGANEALESHKRLGNRRPPEAGFEADMHGDTPVRLDLVERLARARRAPFLLGTNLTVLGQLIRNESPMRVEKGEAIWREGDEVESMAIVLDGSFRTEGDYGHTIAPTGAALGAWEILSKSPRFEGWVAESTSRVLSIRRDLFIDLLEDHFEFAMMYLQRSSQKTIEAWSLESKDPLHV